MINFGPCRRYGVDDGLPIEDIEHGGGVIPAFASSFAFSAERVVAGDRMAGANEKRDKTATDRAGSAGQKYTHGGIANALLAAVERI